MYVIRRLDQGGGWHCNPGDNGGKSFTKRLQKAIAYPTREAAESDLCVGNEVVEAVRDIMGERV